MVAEKCRSDPSARAGALARCRCAINQTVSDASPGEPRASRSSVDFDASYSGPAPPWDIGRPQPVFLGLAESGVIRGRVLDAGCGTGEHVLMVAERGLDATGVDFSPTAIQAAQHKAALRGLAPRFVVLDALRLAELGEHFNTVLDSGLFHVFDDADRARYVDALAAVVRRHGTFLMCCFSDREPGDWGPRRVTQGEIRRSFSAGWSVETIEAARFETNRDPSEVQAWLAIVTRSGHL
jgi:SAM-dependent methyltransferase